MYVAVNTLNVEKGRGRDLELRFKQRGEVAQERGFCSFQLWKSNESLEFEQYLVVTQWLKQEDHDNWTRSDTFRRAHAGRSFEGMMGRPRFQGYTVCHEFDA